MAAWKPTARLKHQRDMLPRGRAVEVEDVPQKYVQPTYDPAEDVTFDAPDESEYSFDSDAWELG